MANTKTQDVYDSFESTFQDKTEIPESLEFMWLKKAIGWYGNEISPLTFDSDLLEFDSAIDQYIIDTLGYMMKVFYQERQVSKVNKIVKIVGKDISIDGQDGSKKYNESELSQIESVVSDRLNKLKVTAYL